MTTLHTELFYNSPAVDAAHEARRQRQVATLVTDARQTRIQALWAALFCLSGLMMTIYYATTPEGMVALEQSGMAVGGFVVAIICFGTYLVAGLPIIWNQQTSLINRAHYGLQE